MSIGVVVADVVLADVVFGVADAVLGVGMAAAVIAD